MTQVPAGAPLRGCRVAVTRPVDGAADLADRLRALGAVPLLLPLVRIAAPADAAPLHAAAARLDAYSWIVFTSAHAVHALAAVLGPRPPTSPHARVAAVGPATCRAVQEHLGWPVSLLPDRFDGAALAAAMAAAGTLRDSRILWPRADAARDALPRALHAHGALLDAPVAYRTEGIGSNAVELARRLRAGEIDVVTLTAPSAVHCMASAAPVLDNVQIAVIGPSTAEAARTHGIPVHIQPAAHTIPALVAALQERYGARQHEQPPASPTTEQ